MFEDQIVALGEKIDEKIALFPVENGSEKSARIKGIVDDLKTIDNLSVQNNHLQTALKNTLDGYFSLKLPNFYLRSKSEMESEVGYNNSIKQQYLNFFSDFKEEVDKLNYLSIIKDKNVVLVGASGVGKSSFASYLMTSFSENIIVIPAQKYIFIKSDNKQYITTDYGEVAEALKIDLTKPDANQNSIFSFETAYQSLFTKLVAWIVNDHVREIDENLDDLTSTKTSLQKLEEIWQLIFPDIKLQHNTTTRTLSAEKNGRSYEVNRLSDGEKSVLYYLVQILTAPLNSYVVVDEPETFLNLAVSNRLWDTLETVRNDIVFIYISHNVSFVSTRLGAEMIWVKAHDEPNNWELVRVGEKEGIPRELVAQLAGTGKSVIFVEGTESSFDYILFASMFKNDARVLPVGGHDQVRTYTEAYNSSNIFHSTAYGIVDGDLMDQNQIDSLIDKNIYTLPVNEIEMMYFKDEVLELYMRDIYTSPTDAEEKIGEFKRQFFYDVNKSRQKISQQKAKAILERFLSREKVEGFSDQDPDSMVAEIQAKIEALNLKEKVKKFNTTLQEAIDNSDYVKILELSPLKEQVSKGLANKYLDSDYMAKMANKFKYDTRYTEVLKKNYFDELSSALVKKGS